jgi:hypothetical protein
MAKRKRRIHSTEQKAEILRNLSISGGGGRDGQAAAGT